MGKVDEILAAARAKPTSPTAKWFNDHPEERATMIEVIQAGDAAGIPRKPLIESAIAALGGPPVKYSTVERWYRDHEEG